MISRIDSIADLMMWWDIQ